MGFLHRQPATRIPLMQRGSDPRPQQSQVAIQGVQIKIDGAASKRVGHPHLQRVIQTAEVVTGYAVAVVMGVDQPRDEQVTGAANDRCLGVAAAKRFKLTNLEHSIVFNSDCPVLDNPSARALLEHRYDLATSQQRDIHGLYFLFGVPTR